MQIRMFSVFDSKAEAFITPFFSGNSALAIRQFAHAANTVDHQFQLHGGDFTLFEIGTFETENGLVEKIEPAINHGLAIMHISATPSLVAVEDADRHAGER